LRIKEQKTRLILHEHDDDDDDDNDDDVSYLSVAIFSYILSNRQEHIGTLTSIESSMLATKQRINPRVLIVFTLSHFKLKPPAQTSM